MKPEASPIGIFDSGIGGLSVLQHIRSQLSQESLIYVADQAHVPYGPRPPAEIRHFSQEIVRYLVARQVKLVVVACNTASAAALGHLRATFPALPIVGMEPAVKPGAAHTKTGKVGVLATAGTFESERYARLMTRFAGDIQVFEDPCPGLVELIEAGRARDPATAQLLRRILEPMLQQGVDTLVLGCTHYPFVKSLIAHIAGPAVTIIDPAPAVARQTRRVLEEHHLLNPGPKPGTITAVTSGDPDQLARVAQTLLPPALTPLVVQPLS